MKKLLAFMAILFLVTSCTTKKTEEKKETSDTKTKVETSTGKTVEGEKTEAPKEETGTGTTVEEKKEETKEEVKKEAPKEKTSNLVDGLEFIFIVDKEEKLSKEMNISETVSKQFSSTDSLKGAKFSEIDFSSDEAKKILTDNEIKEIPVLLVNKNKWEKDKPENTYLKVTKGGLFIVNQGFYNFETKKYLEEIGSLCENKIDDDGDGKMDCEEETCLQSNPKACEKEIKKLQDEYRKKQEEIQKKAKAEQAEKMKNLKSDKPKVDLYVMSECPYGTQAEKPFLEVMKNFKDTADINIKFVQYVMHGKKEAMENLLQYCVQKEQKDKFIPYLSCYLKAGKTDDCIKETAIDKVKLDSCIKTNDTKFEITKSLADKSKQFPDFNIDKEEAVKAGVQGSPTLVIEGMKIDGVARNARAYSEVICGAFKKAPAICSDLTKISDKTFSPGYGFEAPTAASNASAAAGCAQ